MHHIPFFPLHLPALPRLPVGGHCTSSHSHTHRPNCYSSSCQREVKTPRLLLKRKNILHCSTGLDFEIERLQDFIPSQYILGMQWSFSWTVLELLHQYL